MDDPMWVVAAGAAVLILALAALAWACHRVHLPNAAAPGSLKARFLREREQMLLHVIQTQGWTCEMERTLVTADPALARHVLNTPAHTETRSRWYHFSAWALPGLNGVLSMDGEEWKRHTRALLPLFHATHVGRWWELMHAAARRHVRAWQHGVTAEHGLLSESYEAREGPASEPSTLAGGGARGSSAGGTGSCALDSGGPSLVEAVRGMSMDVLLAWAFGLRGEVLRQADCSVLLGPVPALGREWAEGVSAYGSLVARFAQRPLALLCNYAALFAATWRLRGTARRILDNKALADSTPGSPAGKGASPAAADAAAAPVGSASPSAASPGSAAGAGRGPAPAAAGMDVFSRMAAASPPFSLSAIAAEANHVYGAHKASAYVLAHAIHELCQPGEGAAAAASAAASAGGGSTPRGASGAAPLRAVGGVWWRQRLREEWAEVAASRGLPPSAPLPLSALGEGALPVTQAVIWEAQRLHPVSLGVVRRTGAPITVRVGSAGEETAPPVTLPSGCEVVVLLQALHTHPALWPRPHDFAPERWLPRQQLLRVLERAQRVSGAATGAGAAGAVPATGPAPSPSPSFLIDGVLISAEPDGVQGSAVGTVLGRDSERVAGQRVLGSRADQEAEAAAEVAEAAALSVSSSDAFFTCPPAPNAAAGASVPVRTPPFAFVPFLTGKRMCAGKTLAETELVAWLHGSLSETDVTTLTRYACHVHGVPVGIAAGAGKGSPWTADLPLPAELLSGVDADAAGGAEGGAGAGVESDGVVWASPDGAFVRHAGYAGRVALRCAADMYAGLAGPLPFEAAPCGAPVSALVRHFAPTA